MIISRFCTSMGSKNKYSQVNCWKFTFLYVLNSCPPKQTILEIFRKIKTNTIILGFAAEQNNK